MRTNLNFSPFFRSSIGFDRVFDFLENAARAQAVDTWPPYDILRIGEDTYKITVAVAGFKESELSITQQHNVLVIAGTKETKTVGEYLHRGISGTAFERQFGLADHVEVVDAQLQEGLLSISLVRKVPEEMKARAIAIKTHTNDQTPARLAEAKKAA